MEEVQVEKTGIRIQWPVFITLLVSLSLFTWGGAQWAAAQTASRADLEVVKREVATLKEEFIAQRIEMARLQLSIDTLEKTIRQNNEYLRNKR